MFEKCIECVSPCIVRMHSYLSLVLNTNATGSAYRMQLEWKKKAFDASQWHFRDREIFQLKILLILKSQPVSFFGTSEEKLCSFQQLKKSIDKSFACNFSWNFSFDWIVCYVHSFQNSKFIETNHMNSTFYPRRRRMWRVEK